MILKCSTVVNCWSGWPQSAVLSFIFGLGGPKSVVVSFSFGLDGPKVQYCRQFVVWMAIKCGTVANCWSGWHQSVVLSFVCGLDGPKLQ